MTKHKRFLQLLLRLVGTTALLAIPFIVVPYSWMDTIHQELGMGELPTVPIVGYLARSISAFYALLGGLFWVVSYDLPRYHRILSYLGAAIILFGIASLGIDLLEGMPHWWTVSEGTFNIIFGSLILVLTNRVDVASDGS